MLAIILSNPTVSYKENFKQKILENPALTIQ